MNCMNLHTVSKKNWEATGNASLFFCNPISKKFQKEAKKQCNLSEIYNTQYKYNIVLLLNNQITHNFSSTMSFNIKDIIGTVHFSTNY